MFGNVGGVPMLKRNIVTLVVVVVATSAAASYLVFAPPSGEGIEVVEVTETAPSFQPWMMNNPDIKDTGEVWLELINNAQNTIDIEAYYLNSASPPQTLDNIYDALIDAAENREVKVKILTDGGQINREMVGELRQYKNIDVLPWHGGGVLHSKYMIVDGEIVSVGSTNLSPPAMDTRGNSNREINLTLRDEKIAETYTYIFETGWTETGGESTGAEYCWEENWLIPVADGTGSPQVIDSIEAFKKLFDWTENEVYVYEYAYAGAPHELENAIFSALERGVKVEVLVDKYSEANWSGSLRELARHGASVSVIDYPYAVHPKLIISDDDWAYVGSSNIHPTWMLDGREVGVLVNSKEIVAVLLEIFITDWWHSRYFQP